MLLLLHNRIARPKVQCVTTSQHQPEKRILRFLFVFFAKPKLRVTLA